MIDGHSVLGLITARGGSKGLPGKHLLDLGGKPVIAWTIEAAKQSRYLDRLVLSTDDTAIAEAARQWDCEVPFMRPADLARDDTPHAPVIRHAVESLDTRYDFLVLLQPTSPLRIAADIDGCIETCVSRGVSSCVTVSPAAKPPYWMVRVDDDGRLHHAIQPPTPHTRRQDLPIWYALNGAVFVARTERYIELETFLGSDATINAMPLERSLDIDTSFDLDVARGLIAQAEP